MAVSDIGGRIAANATSVSYHRSDRLLYPSRAPQIRNVSILGISKNAHILVCGRSKIERHQMVITIKVAGKVIGFVQSYRLPRSSAVYLDIGGKFEIGVLIMRHPAVHHFGDVGKLLRVLYEIGIGLGAAALCPYFGSAVPDGNGLGIHATIH